MDLAISAFLRGLIVRGSEMKCFGFANSRVITGKAITHSKIIRLWGFAELLQGVKITDMDYREVMAAYGQDAFIFADPPYEVAGEECYDHGQFDLGEFTMGTASGRATRTGGGISIGRMLFWTHRVGLIGSPSWTRKNPSLPSIPASKNTRGKNQSVFTSGILSACWL